MRTFDEIKSRLELLAGRIENQAQDGINGYIFGRGVFIFSWGGGWEHLSISYCNRVPSYDDMCKAKDVFFGDEETAVQYHPKKSEYVNNHPYCLHIWRPTNQALPCPPILFV